MSRIASPPALLATAALVLGATSLGVQAAGQPVGAPGGRATGQPLSPRPELSETTRLPDRRSLVVGDRAYAMGTADGLYPATGWHIRGEMGGVWTPPIKLVDGIWIRLADQWLGDAEDGAAATRTTAGLGLHAHVVRARRPGAGGAHRLRARRHPRHPGRPDPHLTGRPDGCRSRWTPTPS